MNRRKLLFSVASIAAVSALPVRAQQVSLEAISGYLNSIKTAETAFEQVNSDGSRSGGRVIIQRPGRMRFEYAEPADTLVLASGGQVAIFDGKSNQPPEQYPLKRTPLNLILERRVNLGQAKMVVDYGQEGDMTYVTAQDPKNPEYGTIRMFFSAEPVALRGWVVTDESGQQTTVTLGDLEVGQSYKSSTFSINYEIDRRGL